MMPGDEQIRVRFVGGDPAPEEIAAVMAALARTLAAKAGQDDDAPARLPAWDEPRAFEAPNSWSSR
ncbi:MAG: acyl-CoA carboxylase subunit epsilon [Thermoactinospora sp.]|nr:acyl-CoA carboxylase subunit epsilon [Thermoactinospora sp.]